MTGIGMVLAAGVASAAPPVNPLVVSMGWSTGTSQFVAGGGGGTFPGNLTVSVSGGSGSYTYAVSFTTASGLSLNSTTSPTATVNYAGIGTIGGQDTGRINVVVTDTVSGFKYNVESKDGSGATVSLTMTRGS